MKTHLLILIAITLAFTACKHNNAQPQPTGYALCTDTTFVKASIPNTTDRFQSISFLDGKTGYAGGYNGGIYKTTDSAKTWVTLAPASTLPIYSVCFLTEQKGFAAGGVSTCSGNGCIVTGGFIMETTNGGQSWTKVFTPANVTQVSNLYFTSPTTGYCNTYSTVLRTVDGGQTWAEYSPGTIGGIIDGIYFSSPSKGYAACLFNKILQTSDAGATWQITTPITGGFGYYCLSGSGSTVYAAGQGQIIKSTDDGATWTVLTNSPQNIYSMHFFDTQNGIAFGRGAYSGGDFGYSYGALYCTSDGGQSWNGSNTIKNLSGTVQSLSYPASYIGYALNGNGVVRLKVN